MKKIFGLTSKISRTRNAIMHIPYFCPTLSKWRNDTTIRQLQLNCGSRPPKSNSRQLNCRIRRPGNDLRLDLFTTFPFLLPPRIHAPSMIGGPKMSNLPIYGARYHNKLCKQYLNGIDRPFTLCISNSIPREKGLGPIWM